MSERIKFVARYKEGERISDLCKEFGISRTTGHKLIDRYENLGITGLHDRSRASRSHPNETPFAVRQKIIQTRQEHPTWGAPTIKAYLEKKHPSSSIPARSTIHAILERAELIKHRKRKKTSHKSQGTILSQSKFPNDLWCTDFKGQFRMGNRKYCYPLTTTDHASRFILTCEGLEAINEEQCIEIFHNTFLEYGLPTSIRSDNGVPFATPSYFGVSKLSLFWLRLGIKLERILPGHPEENGRHERMHRTLKAEAATPPEANILKQQEKLDHFRTLFNNERPHHSLDMKTPSEIYQRSKKIYDPMLVTPLEYPHHDRTLRVTNCGSINLEKGLRIYIGAPFSQYNLGVKEIEDKIWSVSFMDYELGYFDLESKRINPGKNPFLSERSK